MYFLRYERKTYLSRETKTAFGSRDHVRFNAERKLIRGWAKITWTASGGWFFQLLLHKRPREGGAHQTAKLIDARRRRIPKPFVQHVLEIVGWRFLIIDDDAVLKDSQIILRWPQKLLHSGFHTRFHSGEQFERAVIATNGNVPFTQLKKFAYLISVYHRFNVAIYASFITCKNSSKDSIFTLAYWLRQYGHPGNLRPVSRRYPCFGFISTQNVERPRNTVWSISNRKSRNV